VIDPRIETEIEAGLRAGRLSQRALARELEISRGTVGAIAAGTRPGDLSRQHAARRDPQPRPPVEIGRCPHCGCVVELPCRALLAELAQEEMQGRRRSGVRAQESADNGESLTIALRDEDAERYLALRHRKEQEFVDQDLVETEDRARKQDDDDLPSAGELAEIEGAVGGRQ
jgi:hypothetical protein